MHRAHSVAADPSVADAFCRGVNDEEDEEEENEEGKREDDEDEEVDESQVRRLFGVQEPWTLDGYEAFLTR
jgi:ribosomal protein L12E/L44/L45/RPP1/RPP2